MLNHIVVMGRLVRDPELRSTQSGVPVTSFTLAVDRDYKNRDSGEKSTDFIDIVAWRNTAEFVCKYFSKGRMAVVEGRLQIRDWKDREGNNRRSAEIVADNIYFGDSKRDGASDGYGSSYGASSGYGGGYGAPGGGYGNAGSSSGYGAPGSGYGSAGSSDGYGAPGGGYDAPGSGYGAPSGGYGSAASSGGTNAPGGYNAPSGDNSGFSEIDDQDGELPF